MNITVLFFAQARDRAGRASATIELPEGSRVADALAWIERIKPKRAVLTHMHVDLDYEALARELPQGVEPAYDGMVLTTKDKIADS